MSDNRIAFRVAPELLTDLQSRGDDNYIARRDLERYYNLLRQELSTVNLSEPEAMLIVDACNGTLFEPHTIRLLWAEIDDAIRQDGLDAKWKVDGPALVEKLRSLSPGQVTAVVDRCELFWRDTSQEDQIKKVGLVR